MLSHDNRSVRELTRHKDKTSLFVDRTLHIICVNNMSNVLPWPLAYALSSPAFNLEQASRILSNAQMNRLVLPAAATSSAGSQWWVPKQSSNLVGANLYGTYGPMNPIRNVTPYFTCTSGNMLSPSPVCTPVQASNPESTISDLALVAQTGVAQVPAPSVSYQRNAYTLCYPNANGFYGSCLQIPDYPTNIPQGPMQCAPGSVRLDLCYGV